tara:strand:- start:1086 stop:1241 length:156 start_codon:yes stop_codon:yes gene_type:complete
MKKAEQVTKKAIKLQPKRLESKGSKLVNQKGSKQINKNYSLKSEFYKSFQK